MLKTKTKMSEQPPAERKKNFNEVAQGYTEEEALQEASRCLQCKKPRCVEGCPVEINIPAFIARIRERDFAGAIADFEFAVQGWQESNAEQYQQQISERETWIAELEAGRNPFDEETLDALRYE